MNEPFHPEDIVFEYPRELAETFMALVGTEVVVKGVRRVPCRYLVSWVELDDETAQVTVSYSYVGPA
jgi:hypothetical protein